MPIDDEESSLRLSLAPPGRSYYLQTSSSSVTASVSASASSPRTTSLSSPTSTTTSSRSISSNTSFTRKPRQQQHHQQHQQQQQASSTSNNSGSSTTNTAMSKEERIPAPYPWATERRAHVHSLDYLLSCAMTRIRGEVICKRCDGSQMVDVDLKATFMQVNSFFINNRDTMHDRAPKFWTSPRLLDCSLCRQSDCVKPVVHTKKRNINWLFLLLTQALGLCTLDQLKYFCKHTRRHRTGAKDRVLYLTYVGLLKQLNPAGPYE